MTNTKCQFKVGRAVVLLVLALFVFSGGCSSSVRQGKVRTGSELSTPRKGEPYKHRASRPEGTPAESPQTGQVAQDQNDLYELTLPSDEDEDVSFLDEMREQGLQPGPFEALPEESADRVDKFVRYFQGPQREWFCRALSRSGRYLPQMKEIFREEGLPEDLVYLALIESGFNPYAYSRAHAVGIWQFIAGTGRRYGLVIDGWVDERRDLEKSTRAAARYLKDLHSLFDDWYIAAAAYNAGERKLQRAIRIYESNNFWHISKQGYLRQETKNYVPLFLAAMTIAKSAEEYGFGDVRLEPPVFYEKAAVPQPMELAVIAEGCGHNITTLKALNPQLRFGCTPINYRGRYEVKVPRGTGEMFLAYCQQLPPEKRLVMRHHRVRKGETATQVARSYGVPVESIRELNHLGRRNRLYAGTNLLIPPAGLKDGSSAWAYREPVRPKRDVNLRKTTYVVRKGDTLSSISRRQGVSVSSLRKLNKMGPNSKLLAGQRLVVRQSAPVQEKRLAKKTKATSSAAAPQQGGKVVHVVKRGETLWAISRNYGVDFSSLLAWNGLKPTTKVQAGQRLSIYNNAPAGTRADYRKAAATQASYQDRTEEIWYTVRPGDTLFKIARKYDVTVSQLCSWNKLGSRRMIQAGMRLRVLATTRLEARAGGPARVSASRPD